MSSSAAKTAVAPGPPPPVPTAPPSTKRDGPEPEINKLFKLQIKLNASDLHLQVGKPPILRMRGTLRELDMPPIDEEQMWRMF